MLALRGFLWASVLLGGVWAQAGSSEILDASPIAPAEVRVFVPYSHLQSGAVRFFECAPGLDGEAVALRSCRLAREVAPGQTAQLRPGLYRMGYANMIYPEVLDLEAGEFEQIWLESLRFHSGEPPYEYQVFRDFTQREEQDLLIKNYIESAHDRAFYQELCQLGSDWAIRLCRAWDERDFETLRVDLFRFLNDGSFQMVGIDRQRGDLYFREPQRIYVNGLGFAREVALVPGIYGIKFVTVWGIDVRRGIRVP